jgi:hypothetical protein
MYREKIKKDTMSQIVKTEPAIKTSITQVQSHDDPDMLKIKASN